MKIKNFKQFINEYEIEGKHQSKSHITIIGDISGSAYLWNSRYHTQLTKDIIQYIEYIDLRDVWDDTELMEVGGKLIKSDIDVNDLTIKFIVENPDESLESLDLDGVSYTTELSRGVDDDLVLDKLELDIDNLRLLDE